MVYVGVCPCPSEYYIGFGEGGDEEVPNYVGHGGFPCCCLVGIGWIGRGRDALFLVLIGVKEIPCLRQAKLKGYGFRIVYVLY